MARDGEVIQTQHFYHHGYAIYHTNLSYVTTKLYERLHVAATIIRYFHGYAIYHTNSSYVTTKLYERLHVAATIIRSFRNSYCHVSFRQRVHRWILPKF